MLANKLMAVTAGGAEEKLYVDDVFSTYLYTGNGSTQTINNGIDLAGEGGLVWIKRRDSAHPHALFDTVRGAGIAGSGNSKILSTNNTVVQGWQSPSGGTVSAFNNNGFTVLADSNAVVNAVGALDVSWTFRRAKKFFDVVTYTGNGASNRQLTHSLGAEPGFIITKTTSASGDWNSYHRAATGDMRLNLTSAQTASRAIIPAASTSTFTVSGVANTDGVTYVAYLFAHDPSADGLIQCGSYVGSGSTTGPTINLGWEPQYLMVKNASGGSNWEIIDSMRGIPVGSADATLQANLPSAESSVDYVSPTATGFQITSNNSAVNTSGSTYIFMAIRRPNKPPKSGAEVYKSVTRTGTSAVPWKATGAGFPPDMTIMSGRNLANFGGPGVYQHSVIDRLRRATEHIQTINTNSESGGWGGGHIHSMDGYDGLYSADASYYNSGGGTYVDHHFRRAPGFFDVVCDTGTGAAHAIAHNLTKAPELIIRKSRSAATQWEVWHSALAANEKLVLNSNAAKVADATAWNSTAPGASSFTVGTGANVNASGETFVTYMFATLAGVSKVGNYTGNGSTQTINCGFSTGARFILIKRTNSTGDWYVWDSVRGIVAANDPHLSLNTAATEVTTNDSIDPDASGFIVNQVADTNINVSGGTYIFLAIA